MIVIIKNKSNRLYIILQIEMVLIINSVSLHFIRQKAITQTKAGSTFLFQVGILLF